MKKQRRNKASLWNPTWRQSLPDLTANNSFWYGCIVGAAISTGVSKHEFLPWLAVCAVTMLARYASHLYIKKTHPQMRHIHRELDWMNKVRR